VHHELRAYLERLRDAGLVGKTADLDVASSMLMGSLFSDAMGRDYMPEAYTYSMEEAPARYVGLILSALGVGAEDGRAHAGAEES
jgi:hypothetical protein